MEKQIKLLRSTEWKNLIILDACRFDAFREIVGDGSPVWSPASCTKEWLKNIKLLNPMWKNVTIVNSNPELTRTVPKIWKRRIDLWKTHWEYIGKEKIPTVPPWRVNEVVEEMLPHEGRLMIFFLPPHGPYIHPDAELCVYRAFPNGDKCGANDAFGKEDKVILNVKEKIEDSNHYLTQEYLETAYYKNLELQWRFTKQLLDELDGLTVITSDHGEAHGEDGIYGHPCGYDLKVLREVPWVEIKK